MKVEPITPAQLTALNNKREAFSLTWGSIGEPKTKEDASRQFKRIDSLIAQIKMGLDSGYEDSIDHNGDPDHIFGEDYLDPIY